MGSVECQEAVFWKCGAFFRLMTNRAAESATQLRTVLTLTPSFVHLWKFRFNCMWLYFLQLPTRLRLVYFPPCVCFWEPFAYFQAVLQTYKLIITSVAPCRWRLILLQLHHLNTWHTSGGGHAQRAPFLLWFIYSFWSQSSHLSIFWLWDTLIFFL